MDGPQGIGIEMDAVVRSNPVADVSDLKHCPTDYELWQYLDKNDYEWKGAQGAKIICSSEATSKLVCPKIFFCKQLSLVLRPKNYENGHKNIFCLSVVLELKVENWALF